LPSLESAVPSEPGAAGLVLVVIGDSIPYNSSDDCPGCTGFVDSYGAALEAELGAPVEVINESRHDGARTVDIIEQLEDDDDLLADLASADVIVMSVGFNDQPPFADAYGGCPEPIRDSDLIGAVVERAAEVTPECIDTAVRALRTRIAEVFAAVRAQASGASIAALTPYDAWLGWDYLESHDEATRTALLEAERYWFHAWREAICEEAEAVNAACIDVYTAFNGPDGTQPAGDLLAADYTHPSQEGNDVIRDLLVDANLVGS
jgi:lysophospholipase L1-like esterase